MRQIKRAQQGFTLIEIMITLTVFMIALMGLIALQRASIEGAQKGHEHTAAVNIARYFLVQLQNEIAGWQSPPLGTDLDDESNLIDESAGFILLTDGAVASQAWTTLDGTGGFMLDPYLGHSALIENTVPNTSASRYCVNYRVELMDVPQNIWVDEPTTAQKSGGMVWKARVRVIWPKRNQFQFWSEANPCTIENIDNWFASADHRPDVVELVGVATRELAQ